jgi:hypothetical protein
MIRERGLDFTTASGAVLTSASTRTALGNVRTPPHEHDHRMTSQRMPT